MALWCGLLRVEKIFCVEKMSKKFSTRRKIIDTKKPRQNAIWQQMSKIVNNFYYIVCEIVTLESKKLAKVAKVFL